MNNIQNLLDKYWEGESSLEEEKILRSHFENTSGENLPEQALFKFFKQERLNSSKMEFVVPLNQKIEKSPTRIYQLKRYVFSIAASAILFVGAFWAINNYNSSATNEVIVDDPEVAWQMTKEAFAFLNGKVGKSEQALKDNMVHFEKTLIFKNL